MRKITGASAKIRAKLRCKSCCDFKMDCNPRKSFQGLAARCCALLTRCGCGCGCCTSEELDGDEELGAGDYIAKQNVTIWSYSNDGNIPFPSTIIMHSRVEVTLKRKKQTDA